MTGSSIGVPIDDATGCHGRRPDPSVRRNPRWIIQRWWIQAQHRLYESAVLDALTGVHNRRDMDQRLRAELAFASRHQSPLSRAAARHRPLQERQRHLRPPAGDNVLRRWRDAPATPSRTEDIVGPLRRRGVRRHCAWHPRAPGPGCWRNGFARRSARLRVPTKGRSSPSPSASVLVTTDSERPFANVEGLLDAPIGRCTRPRRTAATVA